VAEAPKAELRIAGERVQVEFPASAAPGLKPALPWQVTAAFPEALVLGQGAPFLAGRLECISVGELMGLLLSGVRSGKLHLAHADSRRTLSFRDGQVVFAVSTSRHERLGRALIREGKVAEADLARALEQVKPGLRIGQVLTREGLLSAAELYAVMGRLVQTIVVNAFELTEGAFLFVEGPTLKDDALKLPVRTRELLLEGLQHGEETVRLRRELPEDLQVSPGPVAPRDEGERALIERLGSGGLLWGVRPGDEGELTFLRWAAELLEAGVLIPRVEGSAAAPLPEEPKGAVERYAELVRTICQALLGAQHPLEPLRGFFADPSAGLEEAFEGVTLSEEGDLDVKRVIANVAGPDEALSRAMAYEALEAFASYALFSAKNALPAELAELLEDEFRRVSEGR
jgi:hypothetical protein